MAAATVVLVHGPCGTPAVWSRLVPLLDDVGVPSIAPHLPSSSPASDLDDGTFLQSEIDDLGGPAVLVGHSGGGFTITQVGERPTVRHLVYLDGFLPDVGETLRDAFEPGDMDESLAACIKVIRGTVTFDTDALAAHLQNRGWQSEEARELTSGVVPSRRPVDPSIGTNEGRRRSRHLGCEHPVERPGRRDHDNVEGPGR